MCLQKKHSHLFGVFHATTKPMFALFHANHHTDQLGLSHVHHQTKLTVWDTSCQPRSPPLEILVRHHTPHAWVISCLSPNPLFGILHARHHTPIFGSFHAHHILVNNTHRCSKYTATITICYYVPTFHWDMCSVYMFILNMSLFFTVYVCQQVYRWKVLHIPIYLHVHHVHHMKPTKVLYTSR